MSAHVLHDTQTGEARSISTAAPTVPAGMTDKPITDADFADLVGGRKVWDAASRSLLVSPRLAEESNGATMSAGLVSDFDGLRLLANSAGTLTAAQLSNGARLLARCVLRLGRLILSRLDSVD